jgi:GNAT superfamily N-acetyltransferase
MTGSPSAAIISAAALSLAQLANLVSDTFADYADPIVLTTERLALLVRVEQLDLQHSAVILAGGTPAGQLLLGLRGRRAWCARLGVLPEQRGRGLGSRLAEAAVERARAAGAHELWLEVLPGNAPAIAAYQRVGLRLRRELIDLAWEGCRAGAPAEEISEAAPRALLAHFARLHPQRPAWQRDLPTLLAAGGLRGLALGNPGAPDGWLLYRPLSAHSARIVGLAAGAPAGLAALAQALQLRYSALECYNEPQDAASAAALLASGFSITGRQHELAMRLS